MLLIILLTISAVSCLPVRESLCHPDDEHICKDGSCIPNEWVCDNVPDCLNGEEENDCHYLHVCAANEFMCRSGECLPKSVKCDGHFDCTDHSDEHGCTKVPLSSLSSLAPALIDHLSSSSKCHPENEYACKDGTCIPNEWMCDNVHDCSNGEDEANCHYLHECAANQFMCRSGECLPKSVKCDGHYDCIDRSDEHGCTKVPLSSLPPVLTDHFSSSKCHPENEYACKNGTCIPNEWMCDNVLDCLNGEDEVNCHYLHECAANQFMCRSGECLPESVKCDGHYDCTDRSDEHGCTKIPLFSSLLTTTDASVIDEGSYAVWVYMLYMVLSLILIGTCCIGLYYYCLFIPRKLLNNEASVKFIVME